jgi:hypothetical protein
MAQPFKLKNGAVLLTTEAPGGLYNAAQLRKIADICTTESVIVKASEDQRLTIFAPEAKAERIASEIQSAGMGVRHYQDGLHQPTACIGELCPSHEQDALSAALDVTQEINDIILESPLKIGINGCATCCIPCHTLDIAIIGEMSGYRISIGGKNSQIPEMASFVAEGVPHEELPKIVRKIISLYKENYQPSESLKDVIERVGSAAFIEVLAPYSQDAAGEDAMANLAGDAPAAPAPAAKDNSAFSFDDLPDADDVAMGNQLSHVSTEDEIAISNQSAAGLSMDIDAEASLDDDFAVDQDVSADLTGVDIDPKEFDTIRTSEEQFPINDGASEVAEDDSDLKLDEVNLDEVTLDETAATLELDDEPMNDPNAQAEVHAEVDAIGNPTEEAVESQLEEKLEESIEEQQSFSSKTVDENSDDRRDTLDLIEHSTADLSPEQAIEAEGESDMAAGQSEVSTMDGVSALEQIAAESLQLAATDSVEPTNNSSSEFSGLELKDGKVSFRFNSGAMLSFKLELLQAGEKTMTIDQTIIKVRLTDTGVSADVDGIEAFLPIHQRAA